MAKIPDSLICVVCGTEASVVFNKAGPNEDPKSWPKAKIEDCGLWLMVECPNCGVQYQAITPVDP